MWLSVSLILSVAHTLLCSSLLLCFVISSFFLFLFLSLQEYVADVADIETKVLSEGPLPMSFLLQHLQAVSNRGEGSIGEAG